MARRLLSQSANSSYIPSESVLRLKFAIAPQPFGSYRLACSANPTKVWLHYLEMYLFYKSQNEHSFWILSRRLFRIIRRKGVVFTAAEPNLGDDAKAGPPTD